jgi:hypothetical protein
MQDALKFEVHIPGYHASVDDSKRTYSVPMSELPDITEEEHEIGSKHGFSDETIRRGKLAGALGYERLQAKAVGLGRQVESVLAGLGKEYRLSAIYWEGSKVRWVLRIEAADRLATVPIPAELADDLVDAGSFRDIERLRNLVLFGVGRQELILRH